MKAIVLNAPHDFCLQDIDGPVVSADELEIRVNLVGICGTDQTMVKGTNPAIQYPIVPGHECMGEVLKTPDGSGFQPGDRKDIAAGWICPRIAVARRTTAKIF
jgi:threonine dehydrogenase-like Zn-dependent dehydrogenase